MENEQEWNYDDALQGMAQLLIHDMGIPVARVRQLLCNPEVKVVIKYADGTTSNREVERRELETYESFCDALTCSIPPNRLHITIDIGDGLFREFSRESWVPSDLLENALEISVQMEILPSMLVVFKDPAKLGIKVAPLRVPYLGRSLWSVLDDVESYLRDCKVANEVIHENVYMVPDNLDATNITTGGNLVCFLGSRMLEKNSHDVVELRG